MKKLITNGIIVLAVALLTPQFTTAQGSITYVSNLSDSSTGSDAVGSDSWVAMDFFILPIEMNAGGYVLNSIQLAMTDASGNPSDFTVTLYENPSLGYGPSLGGSSLGTLIGSTNPVTAGIYTYTPAANLTLSPDNYAIVVTAGTAVANGSYGWSESTPPSSSDGWGVSPLIFHSSDGLNWNQNEGSLQFAINATAVPEPSSGILLGLGVLGFLWHRRKAKMVYGLTLTFIRSPSSDKTTISY